MSNYFDAAKQLGEQIFAYRQLYEEIDEKRNSGALTPFQWIDEHDTLDKMRKETEKQYAFVYTAMHAICFSNEHPEGVVDKELNRAYLEAAYPEVPVMDFCIMQS